MLMLLLILIPCICHLTFTLTIIIHYYFYYIILLTLLIIIICMTGRKFRKLIGPDLQSLSDKIIQICPKWALDRDAWHVFLYGLL